MTQVSAVQQAYSAPNGYINFLKNCSYGTVQLNNVQVGSSALLTYFPNPKPLTLNL